MRPIEESIGTIRTVEDDIGPTVLSVFFLRRSAHTLVSQRFTRAWCPQKQANNNRSSIIRHLTPSNEVAARETNSQAKRNELEVDFLSYGFTVSRGHVHIYKRSIRLMCTCRWEHAVNHLGPPLCSPPHISRTRLRIHWARESQRSVTSEVLASAYLF